MAQVSRKLVDFVAGEEGLVLRAYRCPAGVLTIGAGHTSAAGAPKVTAGMTITRAEALAILESDLEKFAARAAATLPGRRDHEIAGATSFDFNTGKVTSATWPKLLRAGRRAEAETSLKSWTKGGGRVLPGLVKRRAAEADIIFRDAWPFTGTVTEAPKADTSWQADLRKLGYATDGDGVRAFQKAHRLAVDGIVGAATRATIRRALDAREARTAAAVGSAPGATLGFGEAVGGDGSVEGYVAALILLVAIPAAIWGARWLWRNRGRITGRRVWA